MNLIRSKTLPCPPVILAMMSLPQKTAQEIRPMRARTIKRAMQTMVRRALLGFFFSFSGLSLSDDLESSCAT